MSDESVSADVEMEVDDGWKERDGERDGKDLEHPLSTHE